MFVGFLFSYVIITIYHDYNNKRFAKIQTNLFLSIKANLQIEITSYGILFLQNLDFHLMNVFNDIIYD